MSNRRLWAPPLEKAQLHSDRFTSTRLSSYRRLIASGAAIAKNHAWNFDCGRRRGPSISS